MRPRRRPIDFIWNEETPGSRGFFYCKTELQNRTAKPNCRTEPDCKTELQNRIAIRAGALTNSGPPGTNSRPGAGPILYHTRRPPHAAPAPPDAPHVAPAHGKDPELGVTPAVGRRVGQVGAVGRLDPVPAQDAREARRFQRGRPRADEDLGDRALHAQVRAAGEERGELREGRRVGDVVPRQRLQRARLRVGRLHARDAGQQKAVALSDQLVDELEQADALVISAPMHNFTITGDCTRTNRF